MTSLIAKMCSAVRLVVVALAVGCPGATACTGTNTLVFYDFADLTVEVGAPAVVWVVITAISDRETHWGGVDRSHWVGQAEVKRAIRGEIDSDVIKVLVYPSSCGPVDFHVGATGVVAGTLLRDDQGALELVAKDHVAIRW